MTMPAQSTMTSPQQLVAAAKAPILAFNEKNWDAARASISPSFVYEEVATNRKVQGADQVIPLWQGWATAFPDAKATFHREHVSGDTVVFEMSWRGTHKGPLQTPNGSIAPTENRIDVRACMTVEVTGDKANAQRHYFDMGTILQQLGVA
ncbi:MAG TPA: ester cyclase [Gemmatimonadales bacterium]|nr:ester cyclase [Gemmatimonadales bacterium]